MPGADDPLIFADNVRSLGRDEDDVRQALVIVDDRWRAISAQVGEAEAEATAATLLNREGRITALGCAVMRPSQID